MIDVPTINVKATGLRIRQLLDDADMSVRDLQNVMGFTTPQAIYKWLHGKCLPSIDNLVVLSMVLGVSINEIIVVRYSA